MKGGHSNIGSYLSPSGIDGQGITDYSSQGSVGVQLAAGMAGGRRRNRNMGMSMGMAGGSGMRSMSPAGDANWNGDGIAGAGITVGDAGSANLQLLAGMAGGRHRKRRRSMSMYGGTTSQRFQLSPSSTDVQTRAGLGN
jgi:hypothetical protein